MRIFFPTFAFVLIGSSLTLAGDTDWMSRISDEVRLSSLTIPGTHNSAALREPLAGTARCQSLTLSEQLAAGVRFFDLRCCHQQDEFHIYHGPISQNLSFEAVLQTMRPFLRKHPRESLIVSIKQEHRPQGNSRSFSQTLQAYIDQEPQAWYREAAIPRLGDVRGKMVLLSRFQAVGPLGISATDWGHDGRHEGKTLFVQDRFEIPDAETKWRIIRRALEDSLKESNKDRLHLHFTSGYLSGRLGLPNITAISTPINQRLNDYLGKAPHRCHGCLVLDFITPDLARAIYQLNFPSP